VANVATSGSVLGFVARLQSVFFHLTEDLTHVLHLFPDVLAHVDRSALLRCHGDGITGTGVEFDDFLLLKFVFGADDESRKISRRLQVVDDYAFHFCPERGHQMRHEVVGQWALFRGIVDEHRNRSTHAFIHVDYEDFVVIADEDRATRIGRQNGFHLDWNDGFAHRGGP
jgi:hypothetical protein